MRTNKILCSILVLTVCLAGPLAATTLDASGDAYGQTLEPFVGTSTRVLGMGGAGLGVSGYYDSFLINPANLGNGGFHLALPALTVTAYNPQKILSSGMIDEFESGGEDGIISGLKEFLGVLGIGYGDILTTDVSTVITLGNFGLGIEAQERLMSYKEGGDATSTNLVAQMTAAATAGLGFRIGIIDDVLSIDLGVSAKAVYKAFYEAQTVQSIINAVTAEDADLAATYLGNTPIAAGYAFPIAAGLNVNLPFGLRFSTVAKNFNGDYTMTTYDSLNTWGEEVLGQTFSDDTASDSFVSESYTIDTDWALDAGLTWEPPFGSFLKPIVGVDLVDITGLQGLSGDDLTSGLLARTRFGASLRLLSLFDFRYGMHGGYQSFGVGFDLLVFHLDAAYYTQEYGRQLGDKPIDALTVRFSLITR